MAPTYLVVLDTQIWVQDTHLLRAPHGRALLHVIARSGGRLGLPEVVELEMDRQAQAYGTQALTKATSLAQTVRNLTNSTCLLPQSFPEGMGQKRVAELAGLLHRLPFLESHGRECLRRVIALVPPNAEEDQQFKDTAIWLSVLDACQIAPVHFVCRDHSFYEDRVPAKGLASALLTDLKQAPHAVSLYHSVSACLVALRATQPNFAIDHFQAAAWDAVLGLIDSGALPPGTVPLAVSDMSGSAYSTENPDLVALDLTVRLEAILPASDETPEAHGLLSVAITAAGSLIDHSLSAIRLERIGFKAASGTQLFNNLMMYTRDSPDRAFVRRAITRGEPFSSF